MLRLAFPSILFLASICVAQEGTVSFSVQVAPRPGPYGGGQRLTIEGDGCSNGTYSLPARLDVATGSLCRLSVSNSVVSFPSSRIVFDQWSDGVRTVERTVRIDRPVDLIFQMRTEYLVQAAVEPPGAGTLDGAGWVPTTFNLSITARPLPGFRFVRWLDTATGLNTAQNPLPNPLSYPSLRAIFETAPNPASVPRYQTIPLFGSNVSFLSPHPLNNRGQVLANLPILHLWTPQGGTGGEFLSLGSATNPFYTASLNNRGDVLVAENLLRMALYPAGSSTPTILSTRPRGKMQINNAGWMVPVSTPQGQGPCLSRPSGVECDTRFLDASALNEYGQVLTTQGWLYTPNGPLASTGAFTRIDPPVGFQVFQWVAINSRGTSVGYACKTPADFECRSNLILFTPQFPNSATGTMRILELPTGAVSMRPYSINAQGLVVGQMEFATGPKVPFLFDGIRTYDLTTVSAAVGARDASAIAINDSGQILVTLSQSFFRPFDYGTFLLEPAPPETAGSVRILIESLSELGSTDTPVSLLRQPVEVTGQGCSPGRYATPVTLNWIPGSRCRVAVAALLPISNDLRFRFAGWRDGVATPVRDLVAPAASGAYSVYLSTEARARIRYNPDEIDLIGNDRWAKVGTTLVVEAVPRLPDRQGLYWRSPDGTSFNGRKALVTIRLDSEYYVATTDLGDLPLADMEVTPITRFGIPTSRALTNDGWVYATIYNVPQVWTGDSGFVGFRPLEGFTPEQDYHVRDVSPTGQVLLSRWGLRSEVTSLWTPTDSSGVRGSLAEVGTARSALMHNDGSVGPFVGFPFPFIRNSDGSILTMDRNAGWQGAALMVPRNSRGQTAFVVSPQGIRMFHPAATGSGDVGRFIDIVLPSKYRYAFPIAINDAGQILGQICATYLGSTCPGAVGFIWTPSVPNGDTGSIFEIPIPSEFGTLHPTGMNQRGEVVGFLGSKANLTRYLDLTTETPTTFRFAGGKIERLPAFGAPKGINDRGQILVSYSVSTVLLTPRSSAPLPDGGESITIRALFPERNDGPLALLTSVATFTVTGDGCSPGIHTAPASLRWKTGAVCLVEFASAHPEYSSRFRFVRWADGSTNPRRQVRAGERVTLDAVYQQEFRIVTMAVPPEGGRVIGSEWAPYGTLVTVEAVPNPGYRFVRWEREVLPATDANPLAVYAQWTSFAKAVFARETSRRAYRLTKIAVDASPVPGQVINSSGQVILRSFQANHLLLWQPAVPNSAEGTLHELRMPGATVYGVPAINDYGQIAFRARKGNSNVETYLWQPNAPNATEGEFILLPNPGLVTTYLDRIRISRIGHVYPLSDGGGNDFIWTPSQPNGREGVLAYALNNTQMDDAGNGYLPAMSRFFVNTSRGFEFGPLVPAATPASDLQNFQYEGLTPSGIVYGTACAKLLLSELPGCRNVPLAFQQDLTDRTAAPTLIRFPLEPTLEEAIPVAANRRGHYLVRGKASTVPERPTLFDGESWIDLSQISLDLVGGLAVALNDPGQIVMASKDLDLSDYRTIWLLTPVPPPASPATPTAKLP